MQDQLLKTTAQLAEAGGGLPELWCVGDAQRPASTQRIGDVENVEPNPDPAFLKSFDNVAGGTYAADAADAPPDSAVAANTADAADAADARSLRGDADGADTRSGSDDARGAHDACLHSGQYDDVPHTGTASTDDGLADSSSLAAKTQGANAN